MSYQIPALDPKVKAELAQRIKPLIRCDDQLHRVEDHNVDNTAFTWLKPKAAVKEQLKEIGRITTLHKFNYHGFFKPSVGEVLAQLPTELRDKVRFFETNGPENADDLNKNLDALDAGFHVAETILYA